MSGLIPIERIESKIIIIRGQKVLLDRDLADLYGVSTKVFNQAVKRNQSRFPQNFRIQLTKEDKYELVTNCDRFEKLKYSTSLPYAFTEHGALMSANVLNSEKAIKVSILIIEAFIRMREMILDNVQMAARLDDMEDRLGSQEFQALAIIDQLRKIREDVRPSKKNMAKIGFRVKE